ncbi:hypothetical protein BTR25_21180 [Bacillus sp. MRMR6]|nr:hypothetical protein BTR25_21180 [Bacillus sp. MRMR6]
MNHAHRGSISSFLDLLGELSIGSKLVKYTARRQKLLYDGEQSDIRGFSHLIFPSGELPLTAFVSPSFTGWSHGERVDSPFRFLPLPSSPVFNQSISS